MSREIHPLIDIEMVEAIRATGKTGTNLPDRVPLLKKYLLPYDREAKNVIITGCQILAALPEVLSSLARFFDRTGLSYTFLSQETCCGNYLYRPAIKARDEAALAACRELSREFLARNLARAEELQAARIIIFCSPCYPIYKHAFPEKEIVFYPAAIAEAMKPLRYEGEIDYYAGCYRLHRKFAPVPMDLASTDSVFSKIAGLRVNRISAPQCCFTPPGLSHMIENIRTETMVHICTGCYQQAQVNRPTDKPVRIMMLPDFVQMANDLGRSLDGGGDRSGEGRSAF